MYRHFATVTLVLTLAVAFFANGEQGDAAAAEAGESHKAAPMQLADARPPQLEAPSGPEAEDGGAWGSDDGGDFGRPMTQARTTRSPWTAQPAADGADPAHRIIADQDGKLAEKATAEAAGPTPEQIAAATAASRIRSGSAAPD
jgi:hypothetical protein